MPSFPMPDCLIVLTKIDAISLLKTVFETVMTTPEIAAEVGFELPRWIRVSSPIDDSPVRTMPSSIDKGEATAIALALEIEGATLILDDLTARNFAARLGIHVTGTMGVLIKAKQDGHIPSIRPLVQMIRQTNFRLSDRVERNAYILAGEVDS